MSAPPVVFKSMSFQGAPERPLAGANHEVLGRRVVAVLIDQVVLCGIGAAAVIVAGAMLSPTTGPGGARVTLGVLAAALAPFLVEVLTGRSLGKRVMGLRVVRAVDGARPGSGAMIARALMLIVDSLPIGLVMILITERRQRLGDLAAGTVVVRNGS
jgi:uncharacterized RDD family membrane protein YckC